MIAKIEIDKWKKMVRDIEEIAGDDESAHSAEDGLYQMFAQYVADRDNGEFAEIAKEILKTEGIDFARWCA